MTAKTQASILHIMPSYQIGGINRYVIDLCAAMKELGTDRQGIFVTNSSINNQAGGGADGKLRFIPWESGFTKAM